MEKLLGLIKDFTDPEGKDKIKPWQAALFFLAIQGISRVFVAGDETSRFIKEQKKPKWSPPDNAFPIVWTANNLANVLGSMRVANLPKNFPNRDKVMTLQIAMWAMIAFFGLVAFRWKSAWIGAAFTAAVAACGTAIIALTWEHDRKITYSILPTTLWTLFATPLGIDVAMRNKDELLGIDPVRNN